MSPFRLAAHGVTRRVGGRTLFGRLDVDIDSGVRLGVVGPNGIGKSTLLRLLAGIDVADEGRVERTPHDLTVGYLAQEPDRSTTVTARDELLRRTGMAAASAELDAATEALAAGEAGADDRYATALDHWLALGAAEADTLIGAAVADVGLTDAILDLPTDALSGGQAARLSLAAILASRQRVVCLDEPTNDLDHAGLARLERFVLEVPDAAVIVSHDRAFLASVCTDVLELSEPDGRARRFAGGWDAYLDMRATERLHAEQRYGEYTTRRADLESRARVQRDWADKGVRRQKRRPDDNDKALRNRRIDRTEKQASKVSATERALERLEAVEKPWEGWELRLEIAETSRAGRVVASLADAVMERGDFRLGPLDLEISWGERVALVGPNGCGKTTLLAGLLGELALSAGRQRLGPSVVVGRIDQRRDDLDGDSDLLDAVMAATGDELAPTRSLLAKFGLGTDHVHRPVSSLSPGERTRAALALFQARGVNLLVLDEPTNHLDIPAIEQLEQALGSFGGTLVVVSHDRRFLDALAPGRVVDVAALAHGDGERQPATER
ncbi:MAG: ABC-F family ATP-binding cassette domain-containing protein [Actinomycetota bacterium]|nr:ABC-F family ATP-binding cassette domain-containing protein [Actinomycetota bacterium]